MAENNGQFSMEALTALARSPAGQQLFAKLRQSNSHELQRAMSLAASGDMAAAGAVLEPLLADPSIHTLVDQLGGR